MKPKILRALKGAILKWERIERGVGVDKGSRNCPLCKTCLDCSGCPVAEKVQKSGCNKTPWIKWSNHHSRKHLVSSYPFEILCGKCVQLAREERIFLESLLPRRS